MEPPHSDQSCILSRSWLRQSRGHAVPRRLHHFDTKTLPHVGPPTFGRNRPRDGTSAGHQVDVDDTIASVGLNPDSKGAPALSMTATGKGRRVKEEELEPSAAQTFRQAARTGLYLSIDRPSFRFAISTVQLQEMRVARCVLENPTERWVYDYRKDLKGLFGRGLGGGRGHQEPSAMASTCSSAAFPNTRRSPNHRARPKSTA